MGFRRSVDGVADDRRLAVVQKRHRQVGHLVIVVLQQQTARLLELADDRRLDSLCFTKAAEFLPVARRDGQDHSFLGLGDPDFGVRQTGVLQRRPLQPDFSPHLFAHLSDGAAEAARSAIGDGRVQVAVAGLEDDVDHHFLGDGVSDLHRAAGDRFAHLRQLSRGERGAVNSVAAGASPDGDNQITRFQFLLAFVDRDHRHVAAVDQRVAQIPPVEVDGPVDGRNAHAVAVVAHTGDDAFRHDLGVQRAGRQFGVRSFRRREAEDVGVADGAGAQPGSQRIADHTADARVRTAVRFQGRRVIVRLDLEADALLFVERHNAGVVLEHADAPVVVTQPFADLDGGCEDRLPQHVLEVPLPLAVAIPNPAGQRLVRTVLAPGLRQRFQLDVGRVPIQLDEAPANCLHLGQVQIQLPRPAQLGQLLVVHFADGDRHELELVRTAERNTLDPQRPADDLFDGVVGQDIRRNAIEVGFGGIGVERVLSAGCDGRDDQAEIAERRLRAHGHVVGHPRFEEDVEQRPAVARRCLLFVRSVQFSDFERLHDRVGQQVDGNPLDVPLVG